MNYLAQGLQGGFQAGFGAMRDKKNLEKRLVEDAKQEKARQVIREDKIFADIESHRKDRSAARQNEIQKNLRHQDAMEAQVIQRTLAENDPRNVLARKKAEIELDSINNPAPAATPPPPTAKIRQPFGPGGKGFAEFEAPVDQLPSIMGAAPAASYRSPYARDIAALGKTIAAEQSQIDGGDRRSGFLNTRSRADTVSNAQRQRVQLIALELEDKVRAGVISQEEADAEADRLLSGMR